MPLTTTFRNPYLAEAYRTVAFELYEQTGGQLPEWVMIPVGAGSLLVGPDSRRDSGLRRPRHVGVGSGDPRGCPRHRHREGLLLEPAAAAPIAAIAALIGNATISPNARVAVLATGHGAVEPHPENPGES